MARATWPIISLLAVACGGGAPGPSNPPGDGGAGPDTGGLDAGSSDGGAQDPDAGVEPADLAAICGGKAPITLDDWEDCFQRRTCEWQVGCQTLSEFRDVADCVASGDAVSHGELVVQRRERQRAIEQGRSQINVPAFTRCLLRTSATHCNTALFDPDCLTRFTGTIADGGTCYTEIDCRSPGADCITACGDDACCAGTCAPRYKEGDKCTAFHSCEPGLNCRGTCVTGDIGAPCKDFAECDPEAWCDLQAQRCKPTLPIGAECTDILQCGGDTDCIGLSITSGKPGHCLRNARPGDPCDGLCHGNLYCAASDTPGRDECRALPGLGEACSALVPCAGADALCAGGTCTRRGAAGTPCSDQTCLPGLFCTVALADPKPTCTARRSTHQPCNAPDQCESYLCSGTPGVCLEWRDACFDESSGPAGSTRFEINQSRGELTQ